MNSNLPSQTTYALQSWEDAAASFSIHSSSDTASAMEQVGETLVGNLTIACGPGGQPIGRVPAVIRSATKILSQRIQELPTRRVLKMFSGEPDSAEFAYRISTTRIVRAGHTGILVRLRESTGSLVLGDFELRTCMKAVEDVLRTVIRLTLEEHGGGMNVSKDDVLLKSVRDADYRLDIVKRVDARPDDAAFSFQRGRVSLRSDADRGTEASVLIYLAGVPTGI